MSALDIKERYGDRIHIPSDFEVLLVNDKLELDIQSIPKPIKYKFIEPKKVEKPEKSSSRDSSKTKKDEKPVEWPSFDEDTSKSETVKDESTTSDDKQESEEQKTEAETKMETEAETTEEKADDTITEAKDEVKTEETVEVKKEELQTGAKIPKYGVKVILLSLPSMISLYENVYGYDFDKQTISGYTTPLNKNLSFLSFRNQNDGYSLIGGKFNRELDGF